MHPTTDAPEPGLVHPTEDAPELVFFFNIYPFWNVLSIKNIFCKKKFVNFFLIKIFLRKKIFFTKKLFFMTKFFFYKKKYFYAQNISKWINIEKKNTSSGASAVGCTRTGSGASVVGCTRTGIFFFNIYPFWNVLIIKNIFCKKKIL